MKIVCLKHMSKVGDKHCDLVKEKETIFEWNLFCPAKTH